MIHERKNTLRYVEESRLVTSRDKDCRLTSLVNATKHSNYTHKNTRLPHDDMFYQAICQDIEGALRGALSKHTSGHDDICGKCHGFPIRSEPVRCRWKPAFDEKG